MTQAQDFVAHEAGLLDAGRFDDWLALFAEDGHYWVPLQGAAQADPLSHNSIAYEDRLLLQLRIERLKNPRAHSQHPRSHCQHVLQRPVIEQDDEAGLALATPFIYVEARGEEQWMLAGTCRHLLVRHGESFLIRQKRIDLLNAARALPAIQLFI
ncbi:MULTISPECIES: aromatic-ring-hydroxylating dioxygenase subunit beta [unclassified Variovorax]|uniref:aromatic-ring-hydroxylating dioxygenase subunit beta n=1 Tax=unclassified Variovorax TaxID=663243 RepID=UPI00076CFD50|nr:MULTISPECIES: aromatic-ring-hydroxylating dioxygenase subunit beta [unclassified Variovorax]KWT98911.1 3-phenylpropionate dioxygenase beta subunit [Variovorax sp. WDL1]PNG51861.1 Benzene 1,2-dioxygenase subunit beta [Variovorax sp. B2]PNG54208.1 Benzene 1,2-dioxygenase subunit beta [Variovorax sp. B4]VTV11694.1 Benzene 1,2-dioxygenase subunit beta [Variovorax sp. WDL1]